MNDKDLKIQALLEAMAQKFAKYESDIADLRVKYTLLEQHLDNQTVTQSVVAKPDEEPHNASTEL